MKKIEEQIIKAFGPKVYLHDKEFKLSSRDEVVHDRAFKSSYYWLHDNCIFWYSQNRQQFGFSLRGDNTVITRSRLRALLGYFCNAQLYMKNGILYFVTNGNKHEIDPNGIYAIGLNNNLEMFNKEFK